MFFLWLSRLMLGLFPVGAALSINFCLISLLSVGRTGRGGGLCELVECFFDVDVGFRTGFDEGDAEFPSKFFASFS
jgi:hypothetical protein